MGQDLIELKRVSDKKAAAKKSYKAFKAKNERDEAAAKGLRKPNYARGSTGCGTYNFGKKAPPPRKMGLGGRYSALQPISNGFTSEAEKKKVQEDFSWFISKGTRYGNFYNAAAPYAYVEQPRFREKMFGEYGQKQADYENAKEAAAKAKKT